MILIVAFLAASQSPRFGAWVSLDDDGTSLTDFEAHASKLESVSVQFYQCDPDGTVKHETGIPSDRFLRAVQIAQKNHVAIYGLAGNVGADASGMEALLADVVKRSAEANALCAAAVADHLDGVEIDFEDLKQEDRDNFGAFVEETAKKLHARRKLLAISLHEKEKEPGDWGGPQAEDYVRLGRAVDRVRIMCYNEHDDATEAGPIADPTWVDRIMAFAITAIPKNKLEIGIPAYGYDWSLAKPAPLDWRGFQALPNVAAAVRDPDSKELVVKIDTATAWICDAESEVPKLDLAKRLGIRGSYLFRLGTEDPLWWKPAPVK